MTDNLAITLHHTPVVGSSSVVRVSPVDCARIVKVAEEYNATARPIPFPAAPRPTPGLICVLDHSGSITIQSNLTTREATDILNKWAAGELNAMADKIAKLTKASQDKDGWLIDARRERDGWKVEAANKGAEIGRMLVQLRDACDTADKLRSNGPFLVTEREGMKAEMARLDKEAQGLRSECNALRERVATAATLHIGAHALADRLNREKRELEIELQVAERANTTLRNTMQAGEPTNVRGPITMPRRRLSMAISKDKNELFYLADEVDSVLRINGVKVAR